MSLDIILRAMDNFGATAFRCHRDSSGLCDISFKYGGIYIPLSPESVIEWAEASV